MSHCQGHGGTFGSDVDVLRKAHLKFPVRCLHRLAVDDQHMCFLKADHIFIVHTSWQDEVMLVGTDGEDQRLVLADL